MDQKLQSNTLVYLLPSVIVFVVLGALLVFQSRQIVAVTKKVDTLSVLLASTTDSLSKNTNELSQNVAVLGKQTNGLTDTIVSTKLNIDSVTTQIGDVKTQIGGVEKSVGYIYGDVGNLQKLAQADPMLLKKYSKVYFMNENYTPKHLVNISSHYIYSETRTEQFLTESLPFLNNLLESAKTAGVSLYVKSAYRSFAEQKTLKSAYKVTYGAGTANAFSADQGYSEHQLGTTVDFISSGQSGQLSGFDKTASYTWLTNNAYQYGFILSYPKGNNYYVYEPWHWRYVGVRLATHLHENNLHFYDMDQRDIDTYLVNLFDTK